MRRLGMFSVAVSLLALGLAAQELPPLDYFELGDLQLVPHQAVLEGTEAYTGPTCSAIVLAWLAEHGFRALLPDLNEDGVIDEQDTIILAGRLSPAMRVQPERGALDPWLVDAIARYLAERYPDQFLIKLYDDTFREEYRAVMGRPFDPGLYPHITFELRDNATHTDYTEELLSAEGVILGLGSERERNRFFVGRSFRMPQQPEGYPINVVDTSDDPGLADLQAQVYPTYMREGETHWLVAYGGWQPLEFMLALSPVREPELGEQEYTCAEGAFGYDVVTVDTEFGSFQVEECAVHSGERDLYIYTVRNIDFLYNSCGICDFYLPNSTGIPTLDQWGPLGWLQNAWNPVGWSWTAPLGSCGIMPGQSAVFGIAVPAPTVDVAYPAVVSTCVNPTTGLVPRIKFITTGPGGAEEGCPDLVIRRLSGCWGFDTQQRPFADVDVWVKNQGTETAFNVQVCITAAGQSITVSAGTMPPGSTRHVTATVYLPIGTPTFPISVQVEVDCQDKIEECDETNNAANFTIGRANSCS